MIILSSYWSSMHSIKEPSFFFTRSTGVPQGNTLGWIKFLSTKSCYCTFNSLILAGGILYNIIQIGVVPCSKSITNLISQSGGNPDKSSWNISENSFIMGISSFLGLMAIVPTTCTRYAWQPLHNNFLAMIDVIKQVGKILLFLKNTTLSPSSK